MRMRSPPAATLTEVPSLWENLTEFHQLWQWSAENADKVDRNKPNSHDLAPNTRQPGENVKPDQKDFEMVRVIRQFQMF